MAYRRPIRNPLRGSMGRYRGLGDTAPVDIGTSATVSVTPSGATVTGQGASAGYQQDFPLPPTSPADWLNANASVLLWIGGITFGVLLLSRLGR